MVKKCATKKKCAGFELVSSKIIALTDVCVHLVFSEKYKKNHESTLIT